MDFDFTIQIDPTHQRWALTVTGLLLCTFGWIMFMIGVRMIGLGLGVLGGVLLTDMLMQANPNMSGWWWLWGIIPIGLGVIGLLVIKRIYTWVFFIAAAIGMGSLKQYLDLQYNFTPLLERHWGTWTNTAWFDMGWMILGGIAFCFLHRFVIIFLTSLGGTILITQTWGLPAWMPVFVFASMIVQAGLVKLFRKKRIKSDQGVES